MQDNYINPQGKAVAEGLLIIYVSHDDGLSWEPVEPSRVPDWLKEPDVMARLVAGDMAQEKGVLLSASVRPWYRAEKVDSEGETKHMIRLLVPDMPTIDAAIPYIRRSEEAKHFSNFGPLVRELEDRLSERYAGAYVVTCTNATVGLELAYTLKMISGYRKIELPALTFAATWLAANRSGLEITPIDVDPETWIAPGVAGFGLPSYAPVVDAAGAFGEQKVPLLRESMIAVFSLHATKTVGAGEGGFMVGWDQGEMEELRLMTNFHMQSGVSTGFGTNAKLSEYSAAVALASLDAYSRDAWLQVEAWYWKHLPATVVRQKRPMGAYSLFPVKLPCDAQQAAERLKENGVETRRYYVPPMHKHPMFAHRGNREQRRKNPIKLPVTEALEQSLICVPYHLHLSEADVIRVCEALAETVEECMAT